MNKRFKYYKKILKSKKRKKLLGPYAQGVIYNTENGVFSVPIEDIGIGRELGFKGSWHKAEIETLERKIQANDIIYVVGTHVGTLLIPLSQKVKQIIGYEANEKTFWFMEMNLCLNRVTNAQLFNYAVGNKERQVTFYLNTVNSGGSKIKPQKDTIIYTHDNPQEVQVQMIPLDKHIAENSLPQPTGIIMDIEGAEFYALQGMESALQSLRFLYIEFVPHHLDNVSNISTKTFLDLIAPHFKEAHFVRTNKLITFNNDASEVLNYLDTLKAKNIADDILFTK